MHTPPILSPHDGASCPLPLLPHQEEARAFLDARRRVLLALPAGSGKTLTSLDAIAHLEGDAPVLILCPAPLTGVWRSEWARWDMDSVTGQASGNGGRALFVHGGMRKDREKALTALMSGASGHGTGKSGTWYGRKVFVMGYELFLREAEFWEAFPWALVILDESGKVRNPTAKITKRILKLSAEYKVALDGTPVSNSVADLWAPCTWLERDVLCENWWKFRSLHAIMNPYIPGKIDGWRDPGLIKEKTAHLILWKEKREILPDLPEITEQTVEFDLEEKEAAFYKKIKKELVIELAGEDVPLENALVKLLRLRQATFGKDLFEGTHGSGKFDAAEELLSSLEPGSKVVVFSMFETAVSLLGERLASDNRFLVEKITGKSSQADREGAERRFLEDVPGKVSVLLGTSAIERGLNLQKASYMLNLDLPWSYASYDQRIGRIWRKGQENRTTVWNLSARGTVDEYMRKVLDRKTLEADGARTFTLADVKAALAA